MIHFYLFILLGLNFPGALLKKHTSTNNDPSWVTDPAEIDGDLSDIPQPFKPSIIDENLANKYQNQLQVNLNKLLDELQTGTCCDKKMVAEICISSKYLTSKNIEISQNAAELITISKSTIYEKGISSAKMDILSQTMHCLDHAFPVVDMFDTKLAEKMFIPPPYKCLNSPQNTPASGNSMLESATAQDTTVTVDSALESVTAQDTPPKRDPVVEYITPLDTPPKGDSIVENVDPQDSPPKDESIAENVDPEDTPLKRNSVLENVDPQDTPANIDSIVENLKPQDTPANMDSFVENVDPQDTPPKGDSIAENVDPV